jgi:hypothetical protein
MNATAVDGMSLWVFAECEACNVTNSKTERYFPAYGYGHTKTAGCTKDHHQHSRLYTATGRTVHILITTVPNRWLVRYQYNIHQGYTKFPKIYVPPQNSRCQKHDIKQVPYWGCTNTMHPCTKFSHYSDPSHRVCTPMVYTTSTLLNLRQTFVLLKSTS